MAKVILLAGYAPSLILFRETLIRMLVEQGHEVVACAPGDDAIQARLEEMGVKFEPIGPHRTSVNPLHDIGYCARLVSFMRRYRPEVVLAYTAKPVIWGSIAATVAGVRDFHAMITGLGYSFTEGAGRRGLISWIMHVLYKVALARCTSVVFQNPDDRQEFLIRGILANQTRTFITNGSGVDVDQFQVASQPRSAIFLLAARLLADKGIREYVAAARLLRTKYPQARFRLLGWFDDNPAAISKEEVRAWVDEGIIDYRGFVDDIRPEIAAADVYVLPSYREGTPRSVLEAMAMGRAIITTDAPGCRETVHDKWNGFLVPLKHTQALADAMQRFLDEPQLAVEMGARSRQLAEQKYDAKMVTGTLMRELGLYMHG